MEKPTNRQITELLRRMSDGDEDAARDLAPQIYEELRKMAHHALRSNKGDQTLQPTALVNEVWIKLAGMAGVSWDSRRHFVRVAATAMRTILVDRARARSAQKRGSGRPRVELNDRIALTEEDGDLILDVHDAINHLMEFDRLLAEIAELRCFVGSSHREIAVTLGISQRTVERGWRAARAWLQRRLLED